MSIAVVLLLVAGQAAIFAEGEFRAALHSYTLILGSTQFALGSCLFSTSIEI